jgi:hypothetical protein
VGVVLIFGSVGVRIDQRKHPDLWG